MKSRLAGLVFLAGLGLVGGGSAFGQVSVGINLGAPPPPRVVRVRPVSPGMGYSWVDGYWYPVGNHYRWHDGYWTRPPYSGANWVAPRYEGDRWMDGRWEGGRGQFNHDHRWDRDRQVRDYGRYRDDDGRRRDRDDRR